MPSLLAQPAAPTTAPFEARLVAVSAHHDGHVALRDVDLRVSPGSMTLVLGANGSGKSTLLSVLSGTHAVSAGSLERAPGASVAFVVQRSAVTDRLPLTVRETVSMGRWGVRGALRRLTRDDRAIIDESLESLGIADLARRPLGELSGGQRQRALVAQGLARRASLLLLDEPTAGVDTAAQQLIDLALEREIARGAAVVQATHDPGMRPAGALVVRLVDGRRVRD
jgi:zinc/manganese transport system ATP-binding protein